MKRRNAPSRGEGRALPGGAAGRKAGNWSFHDAHFVEADTLEELVAQLDCVDKNGASNTIAAFNAAVTDWEHRRYFERI